MKAIIKQVEGITFTAKSDSGHWVVMDGPEEFGGNDAGVRPMEIILLGVGSCTGMDVVSILNKMKEPLRDFEMELTAERAEEHPKVFTKIEIKYIFYGDGLDREKVEKAIELSKNRYCSASYMLKPTVDITYSYEIKNGN